MLRTSIFQIYYGGQLDVDNVLLFHVLADVAHQFYFFISLAHGTVKQASLPLGSRVMACGLDALIYKICVHDLGES